MPFQRIAGSKYFPVILLLAVNLICGLFTFRDFGLSWDEPLFYDYAQALGYAYSPREWLSGDFNLDNAYGASASDHANRGPGYLLIARLPAALLEASGLDLASAWHLTNFVFFQFGVFCLYELSNRLMRPWASFAAAAFFSTQPLLWGHAFINPKDPPFLVFFTASVWLGLVMIDRLVEQNQVTARKFALIFIPGCLLGITVSIRILGPLAGLIVTSYGIYKMGLRVWPYLLVYASFAVIAMVLTWPYLWPDPLGRFFEVSRFMSANPTQLAVLFNGSIFSADALPRRYLPALMGITLTEPVWILFFAGLIIGFWKQFSENLRSGEGKRLMTPEYLLLLAWFGIPFAYVILRKPPMYDGFRHFLFILPPVFIIAGMGIDKLFDLFRKPLIATFLGICIILPGIVASINLHPYEYTYYNTIVGGTGGAFRRFETDYWLTCYKEAMHNLARTKDPIDLFVKREPYIAGYYGEDNVKVHDYRIEFNQIKSGDFVLVNTRSNEDLQTFRAAPILISIGRAGADFCYIKRLQ